MRHSDRSLLTNQVGPFKEIMLRILRDRDTFHQNPKFLMLQDVVHGVIIRLLST